MAASPDAAPERLAVVHGGLVRRWLVCPAWLLSAVGPDADIALPTGQRRDRHRLSGHPLHAGLAGDANAADRGGGAGLAIGRVRLLYLLLCDDARAGGGQPLLGMVLGRS